MRDIDIVNLTRFNEKPAMYVGCATKECVIAFLYGYEYGTGHECTFIKLLSQHITKRYRYQLTATGWPDMIERFAEKRKLKWLDAYLLLSSEVLNSNLEAGE